MLGEKKQKSTSPKGMVSVPCTENLQYPVEENQPRTKIITTPTAIIVTKPKKKKSFKILPSRNSSQMEMFLQSTWGSLRYFINYSTKTTFLRLSQRCSPLWSTLEKGCHSRQQCPLCLSSHHQLLHWEDHWMWRGKVEGLGQGEKVGIVGGREAAEKQTGLADTTLPQTDNIRGETYIHFWSFDPLL